MVKSIKFILVVIILFSVAGCAKKQVSTPKPRGYFRIEMPEHQYKSFDTVVLPFTFQCPVFTQCEIHPQGDTMTWLLINYPREKARLELSYQPLHNNMYDLAIEDRNFVEMHYVKADNVSQREFRNDEAHVFGLYSDMEGRDVACPLHFWLTDSTSHFLRGTLYFNFTPNNDSVQPVIDYIRQDVQEMIETFKWK